MNTTSNLNKLVKTYAWVAIIVGIPMLLGCGLSANKSPICEDYPKPIGFVSDFEGVFDSTQIQALTDLITEYESTSTNEVGIASVKSVRPNKNMSEFSLQLARCWGLGKKDKNNGVLIVFSKQLRQIHIQNGTGIEEYLTNDETKNIIDNTIIPAFKTDQYYEGIRDAVIAIIKELE